MRHYGGIFSSKFYAVKTYAVEFYAVELVKKAH